jgi:hypothetical protein
LRGRIDLARLANWSWWAALARRVGPLVVAAVLLGVGYLWHASGTDHPNDFHVHTFANLNYTDIIWLYIRDNVARHPRPYLDYPLEYPPLTGGLSYLLGFAPSLRAYFALTCTMLTLGGLATVAALGGLPGANRWWFAATPALLVYGMLNWDLAAVGLTALALLAYSRGRDAWGTLALVAAVWLKFFPLVFLGAILVERLRERRWRAVATIAVLFALGSAAINLPLALKNRAGWAYFFTFNDERRAEPSIWTILPRLTIPQVNILSLVVLVIGGLILAALALRARGQVFLPLGAALLLWWLFVNKIYTPQYGLWVYLALALLAVPRGFWQGFVLFDLAYYVASFQILFTSLFAANFPVEPLVLWQTHYLIDPLVVVRLGLLALFVGWGGLALVRQGEGPIWRVWPRRRGPATPH